MSLPHSIAIGLIVWLVLVGFIYGNASFLGGMSWQQFVENYWEYLLSLLIILGIIAFLLSR